MAIDCQSNTRRRQTGSACRHPTGKRAWCQRARFGNCAGAQRWIKVRNPAATRVMEYGERASLAVHFGRDGHEATRVHRGSWRRGGVAARGAGAAA